MPLPCIMRRHRLSRPRTTPATTAHPASHMQLSVVRDVALGPTCRRCCCRSAPASSPPHPRGAHGHSQRAGDGPHDPCRAPPDRGVPAECCESRYSLSLGCRRTPADKTYKLRPHTHHGRLRTPPSVADAPLSVANAPGTHLPPVSLPPRRIQRRISHRINQLLHPSSAPSALGKMGGICP